MKLYYDSVSSELLNTLRKLMSSEIFSDFRLVGGTALSLQRGHRRSIDIDLFTDIPYGNMPLNEIKKFLEDNFLIHQGTEYMVETNMGYSVYLGNSRENLIKLDIYYTDDDFIFPPIEVDGLRLADEREIAAMKLEAIVNSSRQKDYWDIHELLQKYNISELIEWALLRHPYTVTKEKIIEALLDIENVKETTEGIIPLHYSADWNLIIEDIISEASEYQENMEAKNNTFRGFHK